MQLRFIPPLVTLAILALCAGAKAENPAHMRQLLQTNDCPDCDLSGANLSNLDLTEANLEGANLQSTKLHQTTLVRANLEAADLTNTDFTGANFTGANLQGVNLSQSGHDSFCRIIGGPEVGGMEASDCLGIMLFFNVGLDLCDSIYDQDILWELQALQDVGNVCDPEEGDNRWNYWNAYTSAAVSSHLTFLGANLAGANLSNADLEGANFRYANLDGVNFQGANLNYAVMFEADLGKEADAADPDLGGAFLTVADVQSAVVAAISEETDRERQAEGKVKNGSMNRAQQAYYLENSQFASTLTELGDWLSAETEHYRYAIVPQEEGSESVVQTATATAEGLRSLSSVVFIGTNQAGEETSFVWICETEEASKVPPTLTVPTSLEGAQCPVGSRPLQ